MNIKTIILGEKMPDKNDPRYRERYEKDVEAGRTFARTLKLDKGIGHIQRFASTNRNMFLVIIFVFVFICVALNIYRMTRAYSSFNHPGSAVRTQEQQLPEHLQRIPDIKENHQLNIQEYKAR